MKYQRYALCALVMFALPTPFRTWGEIPTAHSRSAISDLHASRKAYPTAIISLHDAKSGAIFYVESNGRILVKFDKDGAIAWSVDVMDTLKGERLVGQPVIRDLKLDHDKLTVTIGKHAYVEVAGASGKCTYLGAD